MKFKIKFRLWKVSLVLLALAFLSEVAIPFLGDKLSVITGALNKYIAENSVPNTNSIRHVTGFLNFIAIAFFGTNWYYYLISNNRRLFPFFKATLIMLAVIFVYDSLLLYIFPQALQNKYTSVTSMLVSMLGYTLPMLIGTFFFAYVFYLVEAVKQRRVLEAQKLQLEAQISQANFNFLKAQINPHFLHNTLNFLYAKSLTYPGDLSEGILTLSDIMRYALTQGNQTDGKAPLKDEVEHVHNVIKISQLRYSNRLKVDFEVRGDISNTMIIPFVLITLVENAFKHGDILNPDFPLDIKLNVEAGKLYFSCRNKKKANPKSPSTGIGLANIRKRLELAYADKYSFEVKEDSGSYTTELKIFEL